MPMMKRTIKFMLRCLFVPLGLTMLGGTALVTFMEEEPDWDYWRNHSEFIISILPFKI